jgi:hypothetical protein
MKSTAIAAVGAAMLGALFCQPAIAKGNDAPVAKRQITNLKQDVKAKAKKPVLPGKTAQKKPALKAKPAVADATAKDTKPSTASSAKAGSTKLAVKRPAVSKNAATKPKPVPQEKEVAKSNDADGLPPFVQASRRSFEQNKRTRIASMIVAMAPCQKVPAWFALRVAMTESSLNPAVRGSDGEIGLFQMKCETARFLGFTDKCEALFDARTNIYWGVKHLSRALQSSAGDPSQAASKHNAGLGATEPRPDYVQQVMCGSSRSGFPSAYQLGASADILHMCGKYGKRQAAPAGLYEEKDLLTSSIAEIGASAVSIVHSQHLALAGDSCNTQDLDPAGVVAARTEAKPQTALAEENSPTLLTDAKPQQAPVKKPNSTKLVTFVGKPSVAPIK